MSAEPILVADDVRRAFGGLVAVDVEHFEVPAGEIVALIGPNGAGKTTFFNLLTGFERADSGTWSFEGSNLSGKPAYRIARAGMVRTFQIPRASRTSHRPRQRQARRAAPARRALLPGARSPGMARARPRCRGART